MDGYEQRKLLGVVDTTPSTPILPGKQNPFDSEYRKFDGSSSIQSSFTATTTTTTSSSSSTTGRGGGAEKSSSRHPIAEPPPAIASSTNREKKREMDKDRQHSKKGDRPKGSSASKPHSIPHGAGSGAARKGGHPEPNLKPTNILVVSKPKKTAKTPRVVPSSPTATSHPASGTSITPLSAPSKPKQPSHPLGDLFKVDTALSQQQQGGTSSSSHSVIPSSSHSKPFKQKKSRTKAQQHVPPTSSHVSNSDSHSHLSSSASHKTSTTMSGSVTASHHGAVSKPKKSASVHPSMSTAASGGNKDSLDTKVVFPLMKVKSAGDGTLKVTPQPHSSHPSHAKEEGSIDIAHLRQLSIEGTNSLETMEPMSSVDKLNRKKDKKLKKKQKRDRDRDREKMDSSESPLPTASKTSNESGAHVAPLPSRVPPADGHIVPSHVGHMTTSHTHEGMPTSLKVHIPKPRPSELKITGYVLLSNNTNKISCG